MRFALPARADPVDQIVSATFMSLRGLLDDWHAAETWAAHDVVMFGSAFKAVQGLLEAPYLLPTLHAVAERLQEAYRTVEVAPVGVRAVTTINGRQLSVELRSSGMVWMFGCYLPKRLWLRALLHRSLPPFQDCRDICQGRLAILPPLSKVHCTEHAQRGSLNRPIGTTCGGSPAGGLGDQAQPTS